MLNQVNFWWKSNIIQVTHSVWRDFLIYVNIIILNKPFKFICICILHKYFSPCKWIFPWVFKSSFLYPNMFLSLRVLDIKPSLFKIDHLFISLRLRTFVSQLMTKDYESLSHTSRTSRYIHVNFSNAIEKYLTSKEWWVIFTYIVFFWE